MAINNVIGITFSAFDLLHPGHCIMLEQCKRQCDYLIVGLHTNPNIERSEKNVPIQTTFERYTQLKSTSYVDEIIPYDTELDIENILWCYNIDKRFLGDEYKDKEYTGKYICQEKGIKVIFLPRKHNFSSTELRDRIRWA